MTRKKTPRVWTITSGRNEREQLSRDAGNANKIVASIQLQCYQSSRVVLFVRRFISSGLGFNVLSVINDKK